MVDYQTKEANAILAHQGKAPREYELKYLPLSAVTPSQTGDDYKNASSKDLATHIGKFGSSGRKEDYAPIAVDDNMKIIDGNHRHAARDIAGISTIPVLVPKAEKAPKQQMEVPKSDTSAKGQLVKSLMDKHGTSIDRSSNLNENQKRDYKNALNEIFSKMPPKALERLSENLNRIDWARDTPEVTRKWEAIVGSSSSSSGNVQGFYQHGLGIATLDGLTSKTNAPAFGTSRSTRSIRNIVGVYAHELAHSLDDWHIHSDSIEWKDAYKSEINKRSKPLSNYATTNASEGFAEFGRLLYGAPQADLKAAEKQFPKCFAFWRKRGFLE